MNAPIKSTLQRLATSFKLFVRKTSVLMKSPSAQTPPACNNIDALLLFLCDFHKPTYLWVKQWLAYPLLHPGAKMSTALVINGEPGNGKSIFFEQVAAALHGTNGRVIDEAQLHSSYKYWAEDIALAVVNGRFTARNSTRMKELITTDKVRVGTAAKRIHSSFIFISGSPDFLPLNQCNRRFFIIETPPKMMCGFYDAACSDIKNGGVEVFREHLMTQLDMSDFDENTRPPTMSTQTKREAA